MDKKIKAAQLKRRIAVENISALERFQVQFSGDDAKQIPEALEDLERHKEGFFAAVSKLEELDDSNEAIEACIMDRINIEERCRKLKSFLRDNLRREEGTLNDTSGLASSTLAFGRPNAPHLRLPKIELPSFDGDQTKWLSFRDRFIAMIDASPELPSIAKLEYLLSALKGEAGLPFEHTPLTADNYSVTWAALLKRYDNPRTLIREYYRKLHSFPPVRADCVDELVHLVDEFIRHVNGLLKLNEPIDHWDTPLTNLLVMKLDHATVLAWEKHSVHAKKDKYKELIDFVQDRIQILKATRSTTCEDDTKVAGTQRYPSSRKTIVHSAVAQPVSSRMIVSPPPKCPLECTENHFLRNCPVFGSKDVQQRREVVTSKHLCWNCLGDSHQVKSCKSEHACRTCHQRHHTLLHVPTTTTITMAAHDDRSSVILETVVLFIVGDDGKKHEARALLDSGSMSNFISESLSRKLTATRNKINVAVTGIGKTAQSARGSIVATVASRNQSYSNHLEFLVLESLFAHTPITPIDTSSWSMPDLQLADPSFNVPGNIDIVIGGDTFWEVHSGRKRSMGTGKPWLVETSFGWSVTGNASNGTPLQPCHRSGYGSPPTEEKTNQKGSIVYNKVPGRYVAHLPHYHNFGIVLGASKSRSDRCMSRAERHSKRWKYSTRDNSVNYHANVLHRWKPNYHSDYKRWFHSPAWVCEEQKTTRSKSTRGILE